MKKKFTKLIKIYGYKELFYILLYPFFLPFFMLKDTTLSLVNIINSLLKYDWKYLSGNDQKNAYNNCYYYIQDYNIQKFGRYGSSELLVDGKYSLKNWFHVTPFSLRMQASFGTTFIMFFAMCFWLFSWVIFYSDNSDLILVLVVVFFSTLFFATFIEIQNYNILGWMLYPIFLTFLISENYLLLSVVLLLIALSSFTAFFIATILVSANFIYMLDYNLLLTLIPSGIKSMLPIILSINDEGLKKIFAGIGGHDEVKYSRKKHKKLSIEKIYILGMQSMFSIIYLFYNGLTDISLLLVLVVGLFVLNETFIRFSDQQSFYLAYLSTSIFALLNSNIDDIQLIFFTLSIYPIYGLLLNVAPKGNNFISPAVRKPYNIKKTIEGLKNVFRTIPENSKLLIAYKNPNGEYDNLFNGYRVFNEPVQYAASLQNICLFPDWYMVFDNNKKNDDESFWVNNKEEACKYMNKHCIEFVLVPNFYEDDWTEFENIGQFDFTLDNDFKKFNRYGFNLYKHINPV